MALQCSANLVETIPIGMAPGDQAGSQVSISTYETFIWLAENARQSIDIASQYWTLHGTDVMQNPDESSAQGKRVLKALLSAARNRSVRIRIIVNEWIFGARALESSDLRKLKQVAQVRTVNWERMSGAGILHSKFWCVDGRHLYVGSANMDWRALAHVKELGLFVQYCPAWASDLHRIFDIYWSLGKRNAGIPVQWPRHLCPTYSQTNPLRVGINGQDYDVYMSASPDALCPAQRTPDLEAVLSLIRSAKQFIYVSVMDYLPQFLYSRDGAQWTVLDDELRRAARERRVKVRLMASQWARTRIQMARYLRNLRAGAPGIEVKLYSVPAFTAAQAEIPCARLNHAKFMVTERSGYIGTSNWSADYFVDSTGVGVVVTPVVDDSHTYRSYKPSDDLRTRLQSLFETDWNSSYAQTV